MGPFNFGQGPATSTMPPKNFDITGFFDQEAYSDITVKFGKHQVKCHKMILCTKSDYFKNICGPGKLFAEASHSVIELKEDDEDAVLALLRWLYCFDYENSDTKVMPDQFDFHAQVYIVADKYTVSSLRDEALKRLIAYVEAGNDDKLVDIIQQVLNDDSALPDEIPKAVRQIKDDRIYSLLGHNGYRAMLESDGSACLSIIDRLRASKAVMPSNMQEKEVWICSHCKAAGLTGKGVAVKCPRVKCAGRAIPQAEKTAVWMRK